MYGKIFRQMYKGTLASTGPWEALVTFQQMIVLADKNGIVDMTADALSRETTIPIEILQKGIAALEQPDPDSRTPGEDGRRIVRLSESRSWGWQIVNYSYYRNLKSEEERAEYHRQYYRQKRSKAAKLNTSQQTQTDSIESSHAEAEAEAEAEAKTIRRAARAMEPPGMEWMPPEPEPERKPLEPWQKELAELVWTRIRGAYPKGTYREREFLPAEKRYYQLIEERGIGPGHLFDKVAAYASQQDALRNVGTQYIMSPNKFFDNDNWNDPFPLPAPKSAPKGNKPLRLRTADEIEAEEAERNGR